MPDISDFKNQVAKIREAVNAALPGIAEGLALTAKALAERRMKQQGFGVLYSSHPVPVWFFLGKELNARGKKWIETKDPPADKKKTKKKLEDITEADLADGMGTWGDFRAAQGLQNKFVDLSYSNMMWANMAPVRIVNEAEIVKAILGATNREAQNKMTWNFERYGDFIRRTLNEEDGKILGEFVINEIANVANQLKLQ